MNSNQKAFCILGATASGKTRLALALAQRFNCEIISLDSALIYQDMNIGTAKPTTTELASVKHHLIDIISPLHHYSAATFLDDCSRLVADIHARGRLPVIVGGTMMYFHALTHGLNDLPQADLGIRQQLQQDKQQFGLTHLYQQLQQHDPITAARLSATDSQRIERALEVFYLTGQPLSVHFAAQKSAPALDLFVLTLIPHHRASLHQKIEQRFNLMLQHGLIDEVRHLRSKYPDLHEQLPSMRCVGYRQVWDFLEHRISEHELAEQGIIATRQLAKRQLTWLRKLPADLTFDPFECDLPQQVDWAAKAMSAFFRQPEREK